MYRANAISYLGDENSYSYAAAVKLAQGEYKAYNGLRKVMNAVQCGECDLAVLPVENNVEGAVNEVYDELYDSGLYILRQLVLPIRHSLIAADGADISRIRTVVSHPQALAQCRKFIDAHGFSIRSASSTSEALKAVGADGEIAAIALRPLCGQSVVMHGIQDSSLNATRFALLGKTPNERGDKASVSFDLKNKPGALLDVLRVISDNAVNLTRIISRPHRSGDGEYRFFADFDYASTDDELKKFLGAVKLQCTGFRFLGRYDCIISD